MNQVWCSASTAVLVLADEPRMSREPSGTMEMPDGDVHAYSESETVTPCGVSLPGTAHMARSSLSGHRPPRQVRLVRTSVYEHAAQLRPSNVRAAMTRRKDLAVDAPVVPLPRVSADELHVVHRHDWRITEIEFIERQALSRLDCGCGATDYRAV